MKKHIVKSINHASTMTPKGHITIPQKIREALNLKAGTKLEFVVEDGILSLIPLNTSILALKGILPKPQEAISIEKMNNVIQKEQLKKD